jgi:hypothetical protein
MSNQCRSKEGATVKIDISKIKENEELSNPMVVAMRYEDCPDKRPMCFGITVGFGSPNNECEYLKKYDDRLECMFSTPTVQP